MPAPALSTLAALRTHLRALGATPSHQRQVLRHWVQGLPLQPAPGQRVRTGTLPAAVLAALPALQADLDALVHVHSAHPAGDGSERLLLRLADGQSIESVLLPREGLCVSSQVGCAVGCTFCMTGRTGVQRQVGSAEMVAQVVAARRRRPVRKVVFMGMGEPAHNLDEVMEAITLLGTLGGIGHKNLVFSTVGDPRVFERLPQGPVRPALALSLHTTRADLRETLLPRAPRLTPAELVQLAGAYAAVTGYPVQYQWTLLAGINDGDDEVEALATLLHGQYAVLNLIPWNAVEGLPYRRPSWERALTMARALHARGIRTALRDSAGQDVDGGCGQLRARALATGSA